jgi:predicted heme/steroid binding protein
MSEKRGSEQSRSFSKDELEKFDGKEGRPFYIAFKGRIYDLSNSKLWVQGTHMGVHTRNENLAETIKNAPHGEEMLERFTVLGTLAELPLQTRPPTETEKATAIESSAEEPPQVSALDRKFSETGSIRRRSNNALRNRQIRFSCGWNKSTCCTIQ